MEVFTQLLQEQDDAKLIYIILVTLNNIFGIGNKYLVINDTNSIIVQFEELNGI